MNIFMKLLEIFGMKLAIINIIFSVAKEIITAPFGAQLIKQIIPGAN